MEPTSELDGVRSGRSAAFSERIMRCLDKAFRAVGTSPTMEDYIYWRLSLELDDVVDTPLLFMRSLKTLLGEAGAAVFEYKLVEEVRTEFNLVPTAGKEERNKGNLGELLRTTVTAAWTASAQGQSAAA